MIAQSFPIAPPKTRTGIPVLCQILLSLHNQLTFFLSELRPPPGDNETEADASRKVL